MQAVSLPCIYVCSNISHRSTCTAADLEHYRIPGVLQRFSACYFIIALLQLVINPGMDSVLVNTFLNFSVLEGFVFFAFRFFF